MTLLSPLPLLPTLCLVMLLVSCAGQVPPGGGPPDTEPPRVISTSPAPNTTLFRGTGIVLEFDEYVDRRSVEESIFISPSVGELSFDWSGTEVEIEFGQVLREQTTYVVNVGTDVVDTRNKNHMSQAFILAFSTGGSIDRGAIEGRVFPARSSDSPIGVMVFAYRLEGLDSDTLNPRTLRPDYVTQTGKEGKFFLYHLVFGSYRLYAIRDEYRNLLYDPETDEYGIPAAGLRITEADTLSDGVTIQLAKEDTTAPRLIKVSPVNNRLLLAEFSEPIDTSSVRPARFHLTDTLGAKSLPIRAAAARLLPKLNEVFVVTDPMPADRVSELRVEGIKDNAGLIMNRLASAVTFSASPQGDTVRPGLAAFSLPDSARDVPLQPDLVVFLTEPVQARDPSEIVSLRDSTGTMVSCRIIWLNAAAIGVRPERGFLKKEWYRLSVNTGLLMDAAENRGKDTTRTLKFETIDSDRFSSVEGTVRDFHASDTGAIFIRAVNTAQKDGRGQSVTIQRPGPFVIGNILEGQYTLHAFRDRNRNGAFDPGRIFPFSPSERFSFYRDTLKVRARWPIEGILIELK